MQAKNVLYAAVGAPVVAARKVSDRVNTLKGRMTEETSSYTEVANKAIDGWATEGEKVVSGIRDGKVVEEISHKVDLDQAKEQVGKLRDQLEDMLATWRQSFRPEQTGETSPAEPASKTSAAKKPAAKKPAAKKPAAGKSTAAKKPAAKSSAAKTSRSSTAAKKSPAKSTSAKSGASKAKSSS